MSTSTIAVTMSRIVAVPRQKARASALTQRVHLRRLWRHSAKALRAYTLQHIVPSDTLLGEQHVDSVDAAMWANGPVTDQKPGNARRLDSTASRSRRTRMDVLSIQVRQILTQPVVKHFSPVCSSVAPFLKPLQIKFPRDFLQTPSTPDLHFPGYACPSPFLLPLRSDRSPHSKHFARSYLD